MRQGPSERDHLLYILQDREFLVCKINLSVLFINSFVLLCSSPLFLIPLFLSQHYNIIMYSNPFLILSTIVNCTLGSGLSSFFFLSVQL